ncbi:MAG TPA: RluA family pseudouridine synthase [Dehalococcoidia bacterium]|nr:RluA family pseudouridine synthase [Dehalococcoidia bacterium]
MEARKTFVAPGGERLDRYLSGQLGGLSRSHIQRLIAQGQVTVNGAVVKPGHILRPGEEVRVILPAPAPATLEAEAIPLNIVYEDHDLLVVDKPPGLTVHPAPGHPAHTLVNAILARCPDLSLKGTARPGIVHRLDRDTSGLILVAKNDAAQSKLAQQIKGRQVLKQYLVLVRGRLHPEQGIIDAPIGRHPSHRQRMAVVSTGRPARTRYRVVKYFDDRYSLVEATLETGRTHQIRVHFAAIGYPVVGDRVYGVAAPFLGRQFVHASKLGFRLPSCGQYVEFSSELPLDLRQALAQL